MHEVQVMRLGETGPLGVLAMLGTEHANDEPSAEYEDRLKRCFELACYALVFGDAPAGSRLVHGSWHGPNAEQRIRHAWLELPDGLIWEPIHAAIYRADQIREYARMWDERTYDKHTASRMTLDWGHYGPWHESRYP